MSRPHHLSIVDAIAAIPSRRIPCRPRSVLSRRRARSVSGFMNSGTSSTCILGLIDLVEVVHAAGELRRDGTLRAALLLLEVTLALLAFRRRRRAEIAFACRRGPCRGHRPGAPKPPGARTAETAAGTWAAEPAATATAEPPGAGRRAGPAGPRSAVPAGRVGRGPPNPPPGRGGPPGPRSSRARASLTASGRPMKSCPSNCLIAASACERSAYSTKAKPRARPVSRSSGRTICVGSPTCAKCWPQVVFCGLIREITNEQSNWWHGSGREAGRLEAVR